MELRKLTDEFSVAPQIEPEDVPKLAEMGFRTLIINRPDEEIEDADQRSDAIAALCQSHGLTPYYLPYYPGELSLELVDDFATIMDAAEKPALGYCRSGTRSSHLWGVSQAGEMEIDKIVATAAEAGYDHSSLVPVMQYYASRRDQA
ncbi:TIGR01244 family protein [Thioclava sediminum]|uniref:TIGR01244 family phosphatase n=2 Tax=Thioclava TaxID=285107 RepID=A0ABX6YUA6_9RHOB|nr:MULTISPECIES: TIGR01244 family sulfur transferase [Thioclava]MPQ93822.1 TIGR01244 family phosphatase [Thioclava sp. JE_KL1]OOY04993.1 TIGR01244 family protein [Thioclava sp. F28-4]OOY16209.1 TIGR01244 family protein [Thioclava sp. DLFJ4-1]OOY23506.1 TIGR01244 family protein [Thioclava sediminum]QPZ91278.1 TIGR01244 family phosphatase [Thioclava electrotropha]